MKKDEYNFCFSGDNYITNKVRVVFLARDTLSGPPLQPYQILSNYLKQYGRCGLHKISVSGEITTWRSESCLSCTRHAYWPFCSFPLNVTKLCLRVSKLWSAQGWVYNFCFREDNYITNDVRVALVLHARHAYLSSQQSEHPEHILISGTHTKRRYFIENP